MGNEIYKVKYSYAKEYDGTWILIDEVDGPSIRDLQMLNIAFYDDDLGVIVMRHPFQTIPPGRYYSSEDFRGVIKRLEDSCRKLAEIIDPSAEVYSKKEENTYVIGIRTRRR